MGLWCACELKKMRGWSDVVNLELRAAMNKKNSVKAAGLDDVPVEVWCIREGSKIKHTNDVKHVFEDTCFSMIFLDKGWRTAIISFFYQLFRWIWWKWQNGRTLSGCPLKPLFACLMMSQWSGNTKTGRYSCIRTAKTSISYRTRFIEVALRWMKSLWELETWVWNWITSKLLIMVSTSAPSIARVKNSWGRK